MNDDIILLTKAITKNQLKDIALERFGDLAKAVVDIEKEIMAIGGELHADEEALLLEQGSQQKNLWGINLYPGMIMPDMLEFDSIINIRPSQNNRSRNIENPAIRKKILEIVTKLIV